MNHSIDLLIPSYVLNDLGWVNIYTENQARHPQNRFVLENKICIRKQTFQTTVCKYHRCLLIGV